MQQRVTLGCSTMIRIGFCTYNVYEVCVRFLRLFNVLLLVLGRLGINVSCTGNLRHQYPKVSADRQTIYSPTLKPTLELRYYFNA